MIQVWWIRISPTSLSRQWSNSKVYKLLNNFFLHYKKRLKKLKSVSRKTEFDFLWCLGVELSSPIKAARKFTSTTAVNSPLLQDTNIYSPPHSDSFRLWLLPATEEPCLSCWDLWHLSSSAQKISPLAALKSHSQEKFCCSAAPKHFGCSPVFQTCFESINWI